MSKLLTYLVEQTLRGTADRLKEYTLGVEVFNRGDSFDPKTDTIVRVHARRLRLKLQSYYENEGRLDPIIIEVPKGHYGAAFRSSPPRVSAEARDVEREAPQSRLEVRLPARFWLVAALAVLAVASLSISWLREATISPSGRIESIAVLPLENLAGDADQESFVDGMTDLLISSLGTMDSVRVISRTSVMRYKGTRKPLAEIAQELAVQGVVEGTVLRNGDRVRITVQLIEAAGDSHLWSGSYEHSLSDVFTLQREVAEAVAGEISGRLASGAEFRLTAARPASPDCLEAYLKGRYHLNRRVKMKLALSYFNEAIEADPDCALAYSGLADCYIALGGNQVFPPQEAFPRAKAAAKTALELDDQRGETHASLAVIHMFHDWNWAAAEKEFKRALELSPNYAQAHQEYGEYLSIVGRFDEAVAESERAVELDPFSLVRRQHLGSALYLARRYDEAIEQFEKAIEMFRDSSITPSLASALSRTYAHNGVPERAISWIQEARAHKRIVGNKALTGSLVYAYAMAGKRKEALQLIEQLKQRNDPMEPYAMPLGRASIYAALGDKDQAFFWLDRCYTEKIWATIFVRSSPAFDPLRSDPRFGEFLRRMNLEP